jgi:hypothetical protein
MTLCTVANGSGWLAITAMRLAQAALFMSMAWRTAAGSLYRGSRRKPPEVMAVLT